MAITLENPKAVPIVRYYDSHPTEEDLLGQSDIHMRSILYLLEVLEWMFREESWLVVSDLNVYQTPDRHERPIAPDVSVFIGVRRETPPQDELPSWTVDPPRSPPPGVVFEVASKETWKADIQEKPAV